MHTFSKIYCRNLILESIRKITLTAVSALGFRVFPNFSKHSLIDSSRDGRGGGDLQHLMVI